MMQSAESLIGNRTAHSCRTNPAVRRLLPQSEVCAVFVVVANIVSKQSFQMALVHRNDVVQQIMAAAFDSTLCHAVLPRAFEGCPDWPDLQGPNRSRNLYSILAIPIEDQEPGR
jgi:hypothetical protein